MVELGKCPDREVNDIIKEKGLRMLSEGEAGKVIEKIMTDNDGFIEKNKDNEKRVLGFLLGQVMSQLRGRYEPSKLKILLEEKLSAKFKR